MTELVQPFPEETGPGSLSPLIVILGPELASRPMDHSKLWQMPYAVFINLHVCVIIFISSPLWFAVGPRVLKMWILYKCSNASPFDYTACAVIGKVKDPENRFNHTLWVAVVTPTDRPQSVRNWCVIESFGSFCVLPSCFLDFSGGVGGLLS